MKTGMSKMILPLLLLPGCLIGAWALIALIAGLKQAEWQVTELITQYMVATGMIRPFHTLVDFYSHIKGVEYLICVAFFVAFPLFYRYVNEDRKRVQTRD